MPQRKAPRRKPAKKSAAKKSAPKKKSPSKPKKTGLEAKTVDELRKMATKRGVPITVGKGDKRRKLRKAELLRKLRK